VRFYWDEDCKNYCLEYGTEEYELEGTVSEASDMAWRTALVETLEALHYCVEAMRRFPQDDLDWQDAFNIAELMVRTERTGNILRGETE
jgi:hypothetical protein